MKQISRVLCVLILWKFWNILDALPYIKWQFTLPQTINIPTNVSLKNLGERFNKIIFIILFSLWSLFSRELFHSRRRGAFKWWNKALNWEKTALRLMNQRSIRKIFSEHHVYRCTYFLWWHRECDLPAKKYTNEQIVPRPPPPPLVPLTPYLQSNLLQNGWYNSFLSLKSKIRT